MVSGVVAVTLLYADNYRHDGGVRGASMDDQSSHAADGLAH